MPIGAGAAATHKIMNQIDTSDPRNLDISLTDYFEPEDADDIQRALFSYPKANITLSIYSPGGVITAALALYDSLRRHQGEVTSAIGWAASAVTIIALAAPKHRRFIGENGLWMAHTPAVTGLWQRGTSKHLTERASIVEIMAKRSEKIYREAGLSDDDLKRIANDEEVWMNSEELLEAGLVAAILRADELSDDEEFVARAFANIDQYVASAPDRIKLIAKLQSQSMKKNDLLEKALRQIPVASEREAFKRKALQLIKEGDTFEDGYTSQQAAIMEAADQTLSNPRWRLNICSHIEAARRSKKAPAAKINFIPAN